MLRIDQECDYMRLGQAPLLQLPPGASVPWCTLSPWYFGASVCAVPGAHRNSVQPMRLAPWCLAHLGRTLLDALGEHSTHTVHTDQLVHTVLGALSSATMTSVPFHACTSCKANIPPSDKHPLCVRCLGVQHAMDLCTVFQPRVCRNRLRRAMGLDAQSPTAEPSAAFGATSPPLQLS
ncbi:UNVERIFIED_CONTAM: hypothetical protein FKN15_003954 [Acipenser sinensis]